MMGSRGVREFRANGVTRFMVPLDDGVRLVGAARQESDDIHVEIRRMAGRRQPVTLLPAHRFALGAGVRIAEAGC